MRQYLSLDLLPIRFCRRRPRSPHPAAQVRTHLSYGSEDMPLNMDLYFGQLGIQRYELFMMEALGLFCSIPFLLTAHHVQAHPVPIDCFLAAICHLVVKTSAVTTGRHLEQKLLKTAITQQLLHSNGNPIAAQTRQTPCSSCLFATYVLVARRDCNGSGFSKRVFRLCFFYLFHPRNQHSCIHMF
jgi:hypothetical protein